jgi:hypothetical protein
LEGNSDQVVQVRVEVVRVVMMAAVMVVVVMECCISYYQPKHISKCT